MEVACIAFIHPWCTCPLGNWERRRTEKKNKRGKLKWGAITHHPQKQTSGQPVSEQWLLWKAKPTGVTSEYVVPQWSLWVSCPSYTFPPPSNAPSQAFLWWLFVSSHIQNSSIGVALKKVTSLPGRTRAISSACTLLKSYAIQCIMLTRRSCVM